MNNDAQSAPLPGVTVLCGFLGAGKTTLLQHVLAQAGTAGEGGAPARWAAVVNDVAALNVDAAVVKQDAAAGQVVELANGCVCCSSRDDLAESIVRLAMEGRYEHIFVETTGVAEPRGLANLFVQRNPFGRSLGDFARLWALVSVVDVAWMAKQLGEAPPSDEPPPGPGSPRPIKELMLEQIETADVVVLNQVDRANDDERVLVRQVVGGLNPRAEVVETEHGQVASEWLLARPRFHPKDTLGSARWIRELNAVVAPATGASVAPLVARPRAAPRHEERYAIQSFVFQARRPFQRDRFRAVISELLPGLLRAKGFFWTQEQPDEMGFLSVAGGLPRFDTLSPWWAALIAAGRVKMEDRPDTIRALWQEPYGDRRQELVFIGVQLEEAEVRAALESALHKV